MARAKEHSAGADGADVMACANRNRSMPHSRNRKRRLWPTVRLAAGARQYAMIPIDRSALKPFAGKYIWWKTTDEAVTMPERVIAQVMNIGDYDDIQALAALLGDDGLREVLTHAEAGQFDERSWAYWHYRLGLAEVERLPPLPRRSFP